LGHEKGLRIFRTGIKLIFDVYFVIIMAGIIWSNKTEFILKSN